MGSLKAEVLTERQKIILIGKILGDGCLEKNGRNTRLKIDQGEKQKDYVYWLYKEFIKLATKKPYYIKINSRYKKVGHYRFNTYSLPFLNNYRKLFYKNRRKTIPRILNELLVDPLTLAVWYMDDGYKRTDRSGAYLCTSSFNQEEHKILLACLYNNFGLDSNVHYAGGYPRIHIPSRSLKKFNNIIRPFVISSFTYKLL